MVHTLNPLQDLRWTDFLERHPRASVFHSPGWLRALHRCYGYQPFVVTTAAPGESLSNGVLFCRVDSWLTGRRLVSLPFSDHCEPLVDSGEELALLLAQVKSNNDASFHIRPSTSGIALDGWTPSANFFHHSLDLRPSEDEIFARFHKNCIQRKIRRAQREGLRYVEGTSTELLQSFYRLFCMTRRRHGVPPPAAEWFSNLILCMGDSLKVRVALRGSTPVAAVLTLSFKQAMVYKYGGSDARFHNLGGPAILLWTAIEDAKSSKMDKLDLGRTDVDDLGLLTYKKRWGALGKRLPYWTFPGNPARSTAESWRMQIIRYATSCLPPVVKPAAGRVLYRHFG